MFPAASHALSSSGVAALERHHLISFGKDPREMLGRKYPCTPRFLDKVTVPSAIPVMLLFNPSIASSVPRHLFSW